MGARPKLVRLREIGAGCAAFALLGAAPPGPARVAAVPPVIGGVAWAPAGIARLRTDLDAILDGAPGLRGAHVGVTAVDTASGTILYERHADDAFQPASTLKLVVGSAALDTLKPGFAPETAASIEGDSLTLVPGGDPFFGATEVADLVKTALAQHPQALERVVVDARRFAAPEYPAGWTFDDFAEDYAPPISAAVYAENVVAVRVSAASPAGSLARLSLSPDLPVVAESEAACVWSGSFLVDEATAGAAGSGDSLDAEPRPNGCRAVVGTLALDGPPSEVDVAVPDPALYLGRVVIAALRKAGANVRESIPVVVGQASPQVEPDGRAATAAAPAPAWSHAGPALAEVLPRFWIPSDNFVGELLLLHLASVRAPLGATREDGLAVERDWLRSIGIDPAATTLADGSGLSQYDRITPRALVAILQHDWNGPNRQLVLDSLPVGGARGTIEGIAGTPAAGRVFAKTGSMMHVRGLAGYLATRRHGAVTFAFNVDDWLGDYPALAQTRAAVLARIIDD